MTKTQRTILFFLPLQAGVVFFFYYLTQYWYMGGLLQIAATLLLMTRLLTGGNRPVVLAKSAQPILFVTTASLYSMLLVQVYGVGLTYFAVLSVLISLFYGAFVYAVLRTTLPIWISSTYAVIQIALITNFLALAMAYWRLPGFIALPGVFVAVAFVGLWWMIETRRPPKDLFATASLFGLLVSEVMWVYSRWTVLYQLPRLSLIVAQSAVVVTALAYSVGGIFFHRSDKPAKLQLVIEYGAVFVILFIVTLALTRFVGGV